MGTVLKLAQGPVEIIRPPKPPSLYPSPIIEAVDNALSDACVATINPVVGYFTIRGMSGKRFRFFLNRLIAGMPNPAYLEVGTWVGSTLCSAINGNKVRATAIDSWTDEFEGWKWLFLNTLHRFRTPEAEVRVIESDFRKVDFAAIGKFNVYMFDGPHETQDQYDGIAKALPALEDEFVLLVDDWNWKGPREGTANAIRDNNLTVRYMEEIRTTFDESHPTDSGPESDWHNGVCIFVLSKPAS